MAQKVQVMLVDDIDGGEADETVSFSLDGVAYEIDLSTPNAEAMRETLAQYVGVARRVGGRAAASRAAGGGRARKAATPSADGGRDTSAIRAWAKENGYEVSERGRISAKVLEAYDAAH
ncbi:MAG: histone-like nucleoid-structuring protein Lsr2 [Motilibacteraceae bacterium]